MRPQPGPRVWREAGVPIRYSMRPAGAHRQTEGPLSGLAHDCKQHVCGAHHSGEALLALLWNTHRYLRAPGLVQRLRQFLAQTLGAHRIKLDRRDREPVATKADSLRAGLTELDAGAL